MTESDWPDVQSTVVDETALSELVKNPPEATHVLTCSEANQQEMNLSEIINCDHFSNLDRLLRVTTYVLKFVNNYSQEVSIKVHNRQEREGH